MEVGLALVLVSPKVSWTRSPLSTPDCRHRQGRRARLQDFKDKDSPPMRHGEEGTMEVMHARCAGLDVHQKTVVACVRIATKRQVRREVRTFGATTGELLGL